MSLRLGDQLIPKVAIKLNSGNPILQSKTVDPLPTMQNITADSGYDALSRVIINSIQTDELQVTSNGTYTPSTGTYYSNVSVNVPTVAIYNQNKTIAPTETEQTITSDSGYTGLASVTVEAIPSAYIGSSITRRSSSSLTVSGATVTVPAGYYEAEATKSVASGAAGTPSATKGTVSNHSISVTPSVTNTTGYITGGTKNGTAVTVSASELVSGTLSITSNGTKDVTNYASVNVDIPIGSTINNQDKTVTPTTSQQTITADSGYTGLGTVTVNAMATMTLPTAASSSSSGTSKATIGRSTSAQYINIPVGYNSTASYYTVSATPNMTLPTAVSTTSSGTSKLTITPTTSARYLNIPTGYNGTASYYTIGAIPSQYIVPSGNKSITSNGTDIDVAAYSTVSVNVPVGSTISNQDKTISPTESQQSISADSGYTGLGTVTVNAIPSDYVGSSIARNASRDLNVNGAIITAPAGYYEEDASASVASMTLPTAASSTRSGTTKATIGRSASAQYINIPIGYNASAASYTISATPNGSVTAPGTISGTAATVSTGTNTLTLTKTISVTPNVTTTGYISAGTAGNSEISLTASVTTKAAATITPGTSNQTIAAGTYLTGIQTISGDANLKAENIKSGVTIFGKTGTFSGLDTSDADAVAANILYGKTAYVNGSKVTGTMANNGVTGGTITTQGGTYTIPAGYTSGGTVTASLTASTLTNSIINGSAYEEDTGDYAWRTTINIPAGYHNATTLTKDFSSIFPAPDTPATASQILLGYQVYDKDGKLITGTMANNTYSNTLNDTRTSITIPAGYHNGTGTVSHTTVNIPDPTISVSAAGVITASGSWTKGYTTDSSYSNTYNLTTLGATTYNVSSSNQTITSGKYITGTQTIRAVTTSNITAANIKVGTIVQVGDSADSDRILSVTGTFTSDANATAADILDSKTAYVNGNKITGTLTVQDVYVRSSAPSSSIGSDGDIWIQE